MRIIHTIILQVQQPQPHFAFFRSLGSSGGSHSLSESRKSARKISPPTIHKCPILLVIIHRRSNWRGRRQGQEGRTENNVGLHDQKEIGSHRLEAQISTHHLGLTQRTTHQFGRELTLRQTQYRHCWTYIQSLAHQIMGRAIFRTNGASKCINTGGILSLWCIQGPVPTWLVQQLTAHPIPTFDFTSGAVTSKVKIK